MTDLQILIIDDNPDDRTLVLRELKRAFPHLKYWEVGEPKSLEEALKANQFNLVITDYHLGWTTGLDVFQTIEQQRPDCPVIMFTGTGSEEVAVKAMKAGVDDYITKSPSNYVTLAAAVSSVWEKTQQTEALAELQQRYNRFFERVPIGLYRLDPQGNILEINSTLIEMLGYTDKRDLLNRNIANFYPNYQQEGVWQQRQDHNEATANFEIQTQCYNGKITWMRHSAIAVKNQEGEIVYYEGAVEDISDRLEAERERTQLLERERQAKEEAETANRLKDRFFATLSHELRTPLNSILGWMQLLRSGQLSSERTQKALDTIERNARTQERLIEDLLDVTRIMRGELRLNMIPTPLSTPVTAAVDTVKPLAAEKQIKLQIDLPDDLQEVSGDPQRLQQVFWNLLTNGIKFTPEGGKVSLSLEYFSTRARVCVSDTGKGIAPETLPYIFERFQQTDKDKNGSRSGLGLGLGIARHIVESHNGIILARSSGVDRGATFIVELPLIGHQIT